MARWDDRQMDYQSDKLSERIIIEAKTVQDFAPAHFDQLRSYLKATGMRAGLLVNFAKSIAEFKRVEL